MNSAAVEAAGRLLGSLAEHDAPFGARTTYRVGGPAALFVTARSLGDLRRVRTVVMETNLAVVVLGRGSNMLVADGGYPGIVVALGEPFAAVAADAASMTVTAGAAAPFPLVARAASSAGVGGLEWAVGVPGSVGGAVCMNAGGHGSDVAASLVSWSFVDLSGGPDGDRTLADLGAGYRHTSINGAHVVTSAVFHGAPVDPVAAEAAMTEIVRWRRANQPGGQNAGSVFTNPEGDSAGRIVDAVGCRGLRVGSAEVSTKHANFIQADAGGRAGDVLALIRTVRERVFEATGIELATEVRLVGFGGDA